MDPAREYRRRLERRRESARREARRELAVSRARLAVAALFALLAWIVFREKALHAAWLALPLLAFLALVVVHERVIRARRRAERAARFYERGLARLEDRWAGQGEAGERFLSEDHPFALDLDLFGEGSLFELLCLARTRAGEETLARWLLEPAGPAEARRRQDAVEELRERLDLREDLSLLGLEVRAGLHPAELAAWGRAPAVSFPGWARSAAPTFSAIQIAGLVAWLGFGAGFWVLLVALLPASALSLWLRSRVRGVIEGLERPARDLALLSGLLARIESEQTGCEYLRELRAALEGEARPPSRRIARLGRLVELLDARRNTLFAPLGLLLLWGTQLAMIIEGWRARCGPSIPRWLEVAGEFEALGSLSGYAYERPGDPFPEIVDEGPLFRGESLGHPLLPERECVRNDLALGGELRVLVVSGSNMSGKSTLLRTVGVNIVLALAGAPVRAGRLSLSPLSLGATLRIQDSLLAGRSRFYAEITRLRDLVELTGGERPLLFLLDEILHGTNSHDRRIGAEGIVRGLIDRGAVGLVTTHDLALARVADELAPRAANVHFVDHLDEGEVAFDYRLRPGVVSRSNALALMRSVGLEV
jgi:hypothetical protein